MRKSFKDDTAITQAVEKSTQSARALLRTINQLDRGKSSNQPSEEHHSEMSNQTSSDASETPCDVKPFHQWLITLAKPSKEQQASDELLVTHQSGISFERESWDVINNRWKGWYKTLMADPMCTPTAEQEAVIQSIHLRTKYEFFVEYNLLLTEDVQDMTPCPMCHLIHGLPGAGKSR